jgi:2-isopropylmalate synthase
VHRQTAVKRSGTAKDFQIFRLAKETKDLFLIFGGMIMKNYTKYQPFPRVHLPDRKWPDQTITRAPIWCSVDLRDGNQALEIPMNLEQKLKFFQYLVDLGFKTIEIGFPAASDTEYEFTRTLIEQNLISDDVTIQVLTQSRPHIIEQTFAALRGVRKAIVHLYNSTSTLQRDVVFHMNREQCLELAVSGARLIREIAARDTCGSEFTFEYSPESFTGTELDFAVEICDAVCDVWQPTAEHKVIINLPATVEMSTPNVYADQIEYFCRHTRYRDRILVSLHTHNDRGTAVPPQPNWAFWPVPTGLKEPYSATVNEPATVIC